MSTLSPDEKIFISDMIGEYQKSQGPSDRKRIDAIVHLAFVSGRISREEEELYHRQKATKLVV